MPYTRFVVAASLFILMAVLALPNPERINAQACPPGPKGEECRRKQMPPSKPSSTPRKPIPQVGTPKTKVSFTVTKTAEGYSVNLGAGIRPLELVSLKGGQFMMGSDKGEPDEKPVHPVQVSSFALGKFEITQAQWKAVMDGKNPSQFKGDDLPVERVSWNDAVEFCRRLSTKTGQQFRLPTEAEWEYACRAGTQTAYSFGDDQKLLGDYAWYIGNSGGKTHPVGTKKPNGFNLFDMHGNVWEWCSDWYAENYYAELSKQGVAVNPQGPPNGTYRVLRGGSWGLIIYLRSAYRYRNAPGVILDDVGFRVVLFARAP